MHTPPSDTNVTQHPVTVNDTLPDYVTIEGGLLTVYAAYNCNPARDDQQQFLRLVINGHTLEDVLPTVNSNNRCYCQNCGRPSTFYLDGDAMKRVYKKRGLNTFVVRVSYDNQYTDHQPGSGPSIGSSLTALLPQNDEDEEEESGNATICLNSFEVNVTFSLTEPNLTYITPTCGPVSGATVITLRGTDFDEDKPMRCKFGATLTSPVTFLSSDSAKCTSPPNLQSAVTFSLETQILPDLWVPAPYTTDYRFYNEPVLDGVSPATATTKGGTTIAIYGSFDTTDFGRCRFESAADKLTVGAKFSGDRSAILCSTPPWKESGVVNLTVSLNDQQYSKPLRFTFKDSFELAPMHYVLIGLGFVLVLLLVAFVVIYIRHRSTLDGYELIRDGNVFVAMKDIKLGERIGRGTFGEVYKGTWRGAVVAVKKLTTTTVSEEFVQEFEKEVSLMRNLRSPNVLQFLGSSFQPPNNVCIVMEYMQRGSLYGILHNPANVLDWSLVLRMLADTARGMTYLHTCKPPVIHRDLKSHNLLVDEFWRVKVCDFGLSTVLEHQSQTMTACGTPCWTAPEVLKHLHYTVKADVYSFAIVMWECVARVDPYMNIPPFKVIYAVAREKMRPKVPPGLPPEYVRLMKDCWAHNPDARPQFETILERIEAMSAQKWPGQPASHHTLPQNASSGAQLVVQSPALDKHPIRRTLQPCAGDSPLVVTPMSPDLVSGLAPPSPSPSPVALCPSPPFPPATVPAAAQPEDTETTPLVSTGGGTVNSVPSEQISLQE